VAPLGTALTEAQAALIKRYTTNVILLYDSDLPGQKATFRSGDELLRTGAAVRVITLPEGDDPDTFAARVGAVGLERAIQESIDLFDRKVQLLQRGGWFADLRRKREALDKLLPTIRATADRLTRELYLARTAEVAGVSRELLERELASPEARDMRRGRDAAVEVASDDAPASPRAGPRRTGRDRRRDATASGMRAEHELVRVLLHVPRYLERVAERVGPDSFNDEAYRAIFSVLVEQGGTRDAEALARDLDDDAVEVLQSLLSESGGMDRADEVVAGSVNALLSRAIGDRMAAIDRDMVVASDEEKDALLREKGRLRDELNALGRPRWPAFRKLRSQ
jgi:DNA primase